jgi:hypothetical protein
MFQLSRTLRERIAQADDLGNYDGKIDLPFAGESLLNVLYWRPQSVGRRPIDFVKRDSLHRAFFLDPRSVRPRICAKNRPAWMFNGISTQTDSMRDALIRHRTIHYYYGCRLRSISNASSDDDRALLEKIFGCWPSGIEVRWQGPGQKTERDFCKRPRLCPFCFAREAGRIWSALQVYRRQANSVSFLLYFSVSVDLANLMRNLNADTLGEIACSLRRELATIWRKRQSQLQPVGGLVTHQFGPSASNVCFFQGDELTVSPFAGLNLILSSLSELRGQCSLRTLKSVESSLASVIKLERFGLNLVPLVRCAPWYHPDESRDVLRRFLIAPTSAENAGRPQELRGAAALSWEPWHLATAAQWRLHAEVSKGKQLYSPWGDWKDQLEKTHCPRNVAPTISGSCVLET